MFTHVHNNCVYTLLFLSLKDGKLENQMRPITALVIFRNAPDQRQNRASRASTHNICWSGSISREIHFEHRPIISAGRVPSQGNPFLLVCSTCQYVGSNKSALFFWLLARCRPAWVSTSCETGCSVSVLTLRWFFLESLATLLNNVTMLRSSSRAVSLLSLSGLYTSHIFLIPRPRGSYSLLTAWNNLVADTSQGF